MMIGPSELRQHEAVKAVGLPARDAVARAHRAHLVGMHRDHAQPRVQQPLDQQPVRPLQRDQRHPKLEQPRAQRPDARLVVPVAATIDDPPALVDHAHRVLLARPIDPSEPLLDHHPHSSSTCSVLRSARGTLADAY